MDLIKREDAIKAVRESKPWHFNEIVPVLSAINGIPSAEHLIYEEMEKADIEAKAYAKGFKEGLEARKQGEWITEERDSIYGKKIRLKCSECGDIFDVSEKAFPYERFCRYCGARMKGADDERF